MGSGDGPRQPRGRGPEHPAEARRLDHAPGPGLAGPTVLSEDLPTAVAELRAAPGGELQVWGSATLVRWLLEHRLVDQLVLLTYPVVVGQGARLFPATGADIGLELLDLRSTPRGVTLQTYRTTGRPEYEAS